MEGRRAPEPLRLGWRRLVRLLLVLLVLQWLLVLLVLQWLLLLVLLVLLVLQ